MAINLKAITSIMGYQQITSLSASTKLTVPQKDLNGLAQTVRWRDDNVAPTASVGMPLAAGVTLQYDGDLSQIRFIEQTASAKLNITYYS